MGTTLETINHVADKNDRWLLVAVLVLALLGLIALWRWLTSHLEKTAERLTTITDRHIAQTEHLATVVANNTSALQQNTHALAKMEHVMENCRLVKGQ